MLQTILLFASGLLGSAPPPSTERPLLVLPIVGPESSSAALEAELARALRARLGERAVVSVRELDVSVSAERTKDVLGCSDVACFAELLGALGGDWVVGVTLVDAQPLAEVTAILRDLGDPLRAFRVERRAPSLLPARLGGLAVDLADGLCGVAGWAEVGDAAPAAGAGGGSLRLDTAPNGAQLFLNQESIGRAPVHLAGLAAGRYTVRATDIGLRTVTQAIELAPGAVEAMTLALPRLRDWQIGLDLGFGMRDLEIGGDDRAGSLLGLAVGARYQRAVIGPLELGGFAAYQHLEYSAATATDDAYQVFAKRDGAVFGVTASVALHLGMLGLMTVAAAGAPPSEQAQAEEAIAWLEERSTDFSMLSARLRASLGYATPEFLSAGIGVEIGMMSIVHVEVGYAVLLAHPGPFTAGGRRVSDIATHGLAVHVLLGYSAFYRAPQLR